MATKQLKPKEIKTEVKIKEVKPKDLKITPGI